MLILRVWLGVVMIAHGLNHGRTLDGTTNWFGSVGFKSPRLNAMMSAGVELAVGLGMIVGLLTSIAAAGLVATMFVAFWTIHRFVGFYVFHRPDEGYEYVVTLAVAALVIAIVGPGSVSLDAALGIDASLDGWVGAGIVGLGVLAAIIQLSILWRRPEKETKES